MTSPGSGRRSGIPWLIGTIVLLGLGVLVGMILGNAWFGALLAVIVSIGWFIAYASWRGKSPHLHDDDDDGARL
jgi:hypothetical protein